MRFSSLRGRGAGAPGRRRHHQRLLQRQPRVDACRHRAPRRRGRSARSASAWLRCWATCASWARGRRSSIARSARSPPRPGWRCCSRWASTPPTTCAGFGGPAHEAPDAERAAELAADLVREGDVVLVKASRGVGLERVTEDARQARARRASVMGEILIAGLASLLISIFLGPEVHRVPARARVRAAHPRGGPGRAPHEGGHADDGRPRDLHRDRGART